MIKECHNEDAQCAFVVDKILEATSNQSDVKCSFGNIAILYRRQVKFTFPSDNVKGGKHLVVVDISYYRYQEKSSKQPFVKGKYLLMFME